MKQKVCTTVGDFFSCYHITIVLFSLLYCSRYICDIVLMLVVDYYIIISMLVVLYSCSFGLYLSLSRSLSLCLALSLSLSFSLSLSYSFTRALSLPVCLSFDLYFSRSVSLPLPLSISYLPIVV